MASQGWKPGDYLGAENATHSDHYTTANASHIRVLLRDENLGLGAQVGKGNAETFGLSLFSGVLGRLNGKSDTEVQQQQSASRDAELRTYQAQKYGLLSFVSGGMLVGDKIEPPKRSVTDSSRPQVAADDKETDGRKEKKRKSVDDLTEAAVDRKTKKRKKESKEAKLSTKKPSSTSVKATEPEPESSEARGLQNQDDLPGKRAEKRSRRKERRARDARHVSPEAITEAERSRMRQERRARREDRRKRKEEKLLSRARQSLLQPDSVSKAQGSVDKKPAAAPIEHPVPNGHRHAIRQRYIQQKRMACMDPQAMKEIFMLKAAA